MAAFRSATRGDRHLGWRGWSLGLAGAWLLPAVMGLATLALLWAVSALTGATRGQGGPAVLEALHIAGMLLFYSPVLSWVGLILLAPSAWMLLRLGLAGWLNMMGAGLTAGIVAAGAVGSIGAEITSLFGAAAALILRSVFQAISPEIFTAR